jgi:Clp amino terminal domain, pathogenicity island component
MPTPLPASIRLDDLIQGIHRARPGDPASQLGEAVVVAEHLGELADHLVGHFVDQARRSGLSWTEIGRSMGVTKQAAQKRFVPRDEQPMAQSFARFTPLARGVVIASQEEARRGKHPVIAPAHLILGLLHEQDGLACRALAASGLTADSVRAAAAATLPASEGEPPALIPFAAPAKKALELTFRQALRLGDASVGTQHILLALLELEDAGGPLTGLGLDLAGVEGALAALDADEDDEETGRKTGEETGSASGTDSPAPVAPDTTR